MGRRPDYQGGGLIEYINKGKQYDCIYRGEDGECTNNESKWFSFFCREARGKCKDYYTFHDANSSKNPQRPVSYIQKKSNIVEKGDLVEYCSKQDNKIVKYVMNTNDKEIAELVTQTIGKTIGSTIRFKGNTYEIKNIKCRTKLF